MNVKAAKSTGLMAIQQVSKHGVTHPFGDHRTVKQAFPSAIPSVYSDPFLMCDYFDMTETKGKAKHEDDFPVGWHPHRGMDIASYLKKGTGRHGDSLGNRETFPTPGMQWMSVGSGVYHAEGGGNAKGEVSQGFQIWINVPAKHKMDDPDYGTVPNEDMPVVDIGKGSKARILAGAAFDKTVTGPFRTKQPVQMVDFEMGENDLVEFEVDGTMDTALLYVYEGALSGAGDRRANLDTGTILLMDAQEAAQRRISLATPRGQTAGVMLFAGKKLREPIAWRGPIVMNTQQQIYETMLELQAGDFPPKRVEWDYKNYSSRSSGWMPSSPSKVPPTSLRDDTGSNEKTTKNSTSDLSVTVA